MGEVADETGWIGTRDRGERRPGNPIIHSHKPVPGHLLGSRPCTRQGSFPSLGWRQDHAKSHGGPESTLDSGWGMSGKVSWRKGENGSEPGGGAGMSFRGGV